MKISNISQTVRGWFIGDFEKSILRTDEFEVAYMKFAKGPAGDPHYQRIATEYNLVVRGSVLANGVVYNQGDFIQFDPYVVCEVEFLSDTELVVVKAPSVPDDKVSVQCK